MKPPLITRPAVRQIMAFLTVMAAFMFQMRLDALGQLASPLAHAGMHGKELPHADLSAPLADTPPHQHPSGQATESTGASTHAHPATLPDQPRVPDSSNHQHSAHCPFCTTNAFALEADITGLPAGPPHYLPVPELLVPAVFVPSIHRVQARAPPFPG